MKTIYAIVKITDNYDHIYYKFFEHEENAKNELKELVEPYSDVKLNKRGYIIDLPGRWTIKEITLF